jgi:hypothetical protein
MEAWLAIDPVRTSIGLNTWQGVEFVDRARFEAALRWATRLDAIETSARPAPARPAGPDLVARLSLAAGSAGYRVDRLLDALRPSSASATQRASLPRKAKS